MEQKNDMLGVEDIVFMLLETLKSNGTFDEIRRHCVTDIDAKPTYQNWKQRIESNVNKFLSKVKYTPELNKNTVRERLRKHLLDGRETQDIEEGADRILTQVLAPRTLSIFEPKIAVAVDEYLGIKNEAPPIELNGLKESSMNSINVSNIENSNIFNPKIDFIPGADNIPCDKTQKDDRKDLRSDKKEKSSSLCKEPKSLNGNRTDDENDTGGSLKQKSSQYKNKTSASDKSKSTSTNHKSNKKDNSCKEVVDKSKDIVDKSKDIVDKSKDIINKPNDIVCKPKDIIDKSKEVVNKSKDVIDKSKDVIDKSKDVSKPKDIVDKSKDVSKPKDIVEKSKDIINKSKDANDKSKDIINKSKDANDKSKDIGKPKDIVDKSKDISKPKDIVDKSKDVSKPKDIVDKSKDIIKSKDANDKSKDIVNKTKDMVDKSKEKSFLSKNSYSNSSSHKNNRTDTKRTKRSLEEKKKSSSLCKEPKLLNGNRSDDESNAGGSSKQKSTIHKNKSSSSDKSKSSSSNHKSSRKDNTSTDVVDKSKDKSLSKNSTYTDVDKSKNKSSLSKNSNRAVDKSKDKSLSKNSSSTDIDKSKEKSLSKNSSSTDTDKSKEKSSSKNSNSTNIDKSKDKSLSKGSSSTDINKSKYKSLSKNSSSSTVVDKSKDKSSSKNSNRAVDKSKDKYLSKNSSSTDKSKDKSLSKSSSSTDIDKSKNKSLTKNSTCSSHKSNRNDSKRLKLSQPEKNKLPINNESVEENKSEKPEESEWNDFRSSNITNDEQDAANVLLSMSTISYESSHSEIITENIIFIENSPPIPETLKTSKIENELEVKENVDQKKILPSSDNDDIKENSQLKSNNLETSQLLNTVKSVSSIVGHLFEKVCSVDIERLPCKDIKLQCKSVNNVEIPEEHQKPSEIKVDEKELKILNVENNLDPSENEKTNECNSHDILKVPKLKLKLLPNQIDSLNKCKRKKHHKDKEHKKLKLSKSFDVPNEVSVPVIDNVSTSIMCEKLEEKSNNDTDVKINDSASTLSKQILHEEIENDSVKVLDDDKLHYSFKGFSEAETIPCKNYKLLKNVIKALQAKVNNHDVINDGFKGFTSAEIHPCKHRDIVYAELIKLKDSKSSSDFIGFSEEDAQMSIGHKYVIQQLELAKKQNNVDNHQQSVNCGGNGKIFNEVVVEYLYESNNDNVTTSKEIYSKPINDTKKDCPTVNNNNHNHDNWVVEQEMKYKLLPVKVKLERLFEYTCNNVKHVSDSSQVPI